jgi:hypothetical protein
VHDHGRRRGQSRRPSHRMLMAGREAFRQQAAPPREPPRSPC